MNRVPMRGSHLSLHLLVLLAFLALGLLLTWPMAAHFANHVPGDGIDDPSLAWNLWWAKHALVDQPQDPFDVRWQFWPVGINLAFYTLTLLNGALGIPLQLVFGLVPAYNLLLLSSFVFGGVGAYLLCLQLLSDWLPRPAGEGDRGRGSGPYFAAFIAGAFYAFASSKLFYASLGQANIASSQWIPFAMLYMVRSVRPRGSWRDAAMAALFAGLQAYAEMTYASFLLIFAITVLAWQTIREVHGLRHTVRVARVRPWAAPIIGYLLRFALFSAVFLLAVLPILAAMLPDLRTEGDFFASGGGFAGLFSADLAGYALPTQLHPILGGLVRAAANDSQPRADGSHMPVNKGQQIYVGYAALALVGFGLRRWRVARGRWSAPVAGAMDRRSTACAPALSPRFWLFSALFFFILTLGPSLRVLGYDLGLPLPFAIVSRLPFFEGNRYPSRYSVMLLASLAPLVALGIVLVGSRTAPWAASRGTGVAYALMPAVLIALLLFEHLSAPLPVFDLRVPALYERVAAQPGDFALLEVPPGWRNGARVAGKKDTVIMQQLWNGTVHGKRLLGGNTSRNPESKFQYFSEDPTLARLIATTNAADVPQHDALRAYLRDQPVTDAERERARTWAAFAGVRYVMVHRDKIPLETESLLRELLPLEQVAEEGGLALYRVAVGSPPTRFVLASDEGRMALAEGWSPAGLGQGVYAQRTEPRLLLPLGTGAVTVRLHARAMGPGQSVSLRVGDQVTDPQPLPQDWVTLEFALQADPARPPLSETSVRFEKLYDAGAVPALAGPVVLGAASLSSAVPTMVVRSAGEEIGDFAHIYLGGQDVSPNARGYNLVAVDSATGRLLDVAAFDTHADPAASAALAGWVAGLPAGAVVAGAVRDEASTNLGEEAVAALNSLGLATDLRGHFRWAHAFIGARGARPGTALEALDAVRPAQVSAGPALSKPEVAAEVAEVGVAGF